MRGHDSIVHQDVAVSVVIPMRNETNHIGRCLDSLVNQTFAHDRYEILVVDGRSTDNSKQVAAHYATSDVCVRLLDNPSQITPTGMNLGLRAAHGTIIVIAGAHTSYPADFVKNCVECLEKTGADVVGGPIETVVDSDCLSARLVATILSSPFGVGNSKFRTSDIAGFVDTVPFGAFRREIFERAGMYNEKLVRNQDNELNARIRKVGGRIYLTPVLKTHYHPAKTFVGLLNYAFKTSQWHIFTVRESMASMNSRHFAPALFLILLLSLFLLSFVGMWALWSLIGTLFSYLLVGFYFSVREYNQKKRDLVFLQPLATFCFHVAYGAGTIAGLKYLFLQPSPTPIRHGMPTQS